jgi:hypothetical protein
MDLMKNWQAMRTLFVEITAMPVVLTVQAFSIGADKETRRNSKSILRANRPIL